MNLDIANMVMNIGQTSQGFDWGNFWTALFAAGFGAWGAYGLNIRKQKNDEKRNKFIKLNKLINISQMFGNKTCAYLKNLYNSKISNTALSLDIVKINELENSFLGDYNVHFLYFINYFNQLINHLETLIEQYNKATLLKQTNNLLEVHDDINKVYNELYERIIEDILILRYLNHILLKNLYTTRDRYFIKSVSNDIFFDKISPTLESIYLETIKNYSEFPTYVKIDNMFKNNYVNKTNSTCMYCHFRYWLKFIKNNIKSFFTPPERCPKKIKGKEGGDDL